MSLKEEKKRWERETYEPLVNRFPERKNDFKTSSGFSMPPVMLPSETQNYLEALGFPGEYPFTRGVQPTMYRGRFWTMRQYAGYASAEESNARYRYLLEQGQTCLSVAFEVLMPTTHWRKERLGKWVCRFPQWRIWKPYSGGSLWKRFLPV